MISIVILSTLRGHIASAALIVLLCSSVFIMSLDGLQFVAELPRDEVDPRFVKSFDCSNPDGTAGAVDFFDEFGFVVLGSVFDATECATTRDAMWNILESANPEFNHADQSTWSTLKSKGNYGLSTRGPSFHPTLVNNRQNEKLVKALHALVTSPDPCEQKVTSEGTHSDVTDLIVSHDRFTVYRATVLEQELRGVVDGAQFSTGERNIHLDMNPWWWHESSPDILKGLETLQYKYRLDPVEDSSDTGGAGSGSAGGGAVSDKAQAKRAAKAAVAVNEHQDFVRENNMVVQCMGRHVQCVLNFHTNLEEDGGTLVVPMFHKYVRRYCEDYKHLRKPLPWVQFSKEVEEVLLRHSHRVPMREGSVLVWDQRLAHGTAPNSSSACRMAQYMKAGLRSKSYALHRCVSNSGGSDGTEGGSVSAAGIATTATESVASTDSTVSNTVPALSARLLRRSTALDYILRANNARDIVTPLGESLFALDVL